MPFKTMLTIIGVDHPDADLEAVIDLCRDTGAHLSVLVIATAAGPPVTDYAAMSADVWLRARQEDERRLEERLEQVTALAARHDDLSADVSSEYEEATLIHHVVGRHARYADLTLVGPALFRRTDLKASILNGVLFEAKRPVLIVPESRSAPLRPGVVMVAWDSSLAASRAVREAIDLLAAADAVHVTMVDPEAAHGLNGPEPGADIAAYLARHGAKVTVDRLPGLGLSTAEALRRHAVDISADLIVMGAYGHSRLRQRFFGGVTRSVVEEASFPVLMAR